MPLGPLALVDKSSLDGGNKLLRSALEIGIVRRVMARQPHHGRMMEVVVPKGIHAVPLLRKRANGLHIKTVSGGM